MQKMGSPSDFVSEISHVKLRWMGSPRNVIHLPSGNSTVCELANGVEIVSVPFVIAWWILNHRFFGQGFVPDWVYVSIVFVCLPSGNQTWLAGKYTIYYADFPIESPISRGFPSYVWWDRRVRRRVRPGASRQVLCCAEERPFQITTRWGFTMLWWIYPKKGRVG